MLGDFAKAIGQLPDPRFRRVLLLGLGLTIALLAGATILFGWVVGLFVPDVVTLPFIGDVSWISSVASWATVLLMIVLSVVLMVPVAAAFTGIFLDDVAEAVEERHYPGLEPVGTIPLMDTLRDSVSLIAVTIGVNLVALILFFFVGPLAPVLFWAVNGYLLGREFFQMAAMRREGRDGANRLRRRHGPVRYFRQEEGEGR
jgi:CysZ protein